MQALGREALPEGARAAKRDGYGRLEGAGSLDCGVVVGAVVVGAGVVVLGAGAVVLGTVPAARGRLTLVTPFECRHCTWREGNRVEVIAPVDVHAEVQRRGEVVVHDEDLGAVGVLKRGVFITESRSVVPIRTAPGRTNFDT